MNLRALQVEMGEWHLRTFPGKTVQEIALKLGEESGEAMGAVVKRGECLRGERKGDPEDWTENFAEELGHVMHVLLVLAFYEGFDLQEILETTSKATMARVWK